MRSFVAALAIALFAVACDQRDADPPPNATSHAPDTAVLQLADSIFAAARNRDADRFVAYFRDRPDFVYLINGTRFDSRGALHGAFSSMLSNQRRFEPVWRERQVLALKDDVAVFTGEFITNAQDNSGEEWQARGVVTFVAIREPNGWRVAHWHTTES